MQCMFRYTAKLTVSEKCLLKSCEVKDGES
jgi:hypothetical protein